MENNLKDQHYKNMGITLQMDTLAFEAESVAFAVCAHFLLDTSDYSFPYIAGWSSSVDMKELKNSMDTIRKTAGEIIDGVESELEKQQEKTEKEISGENRPSVLNELAEEKKSLAARSGKGSEKAVRIADRPVRVPSGREAR